jgi:hypothetical protein
MEKAMGIEAVPLYNGACGLRRRFFLIIRAFEEPYGSLEGNRLGALVRLFAQNVRIYAYPMTPRICADGSTPLPPPLRNRVKRPDGFLPPNFVARRLSDTCSPIFSPATLPSLCKCPRP